ncbi:MAG: 4-hydroxy-tetrahydrodipicolinate synthase [Lysobacteraceae bacterium]|nr:MAG: 4-hydroxy-tetrahydrodipicolinate synthase [Xanthomonadaceae bacterium]
MMDLSGSIVAIVTPFDSTGELDMDAYVSLLDWHVDSGTAAIVVAGSTGESGSLSAGEKDRLIAAAVEQVNGRVPVIAGTGAAATAATIEATRRAAALGADAALVVTPYYVRPPQRGLVAHFRAVADATDLPLLLYNVPSRTGVDMLPSTVEQLSGYRSIIGLKEANASIERMRELVRTVGGQMILLSGDDDSCARSIAEGARGVISVVANVAPAMMADLCRMGLEGRSDQAAVLSDQMQPLFKAMSCDSNPIPVKWALAQQGRCKDHVRLPLVSLASEQHATVRDAMSELIQ